MKYLRVLLLLIPALLLLPTAYAQPITAVNIAGQLSGTIGTTTVMISVEAHATGSPSSLTGAGVDSSAHAGTLLSLIGAPGECTWKLTSGSTDGTSVTLSGTVVQSTGSFVGTHVSIMADASTGAITFHFGTLVFTGTGTVVMNNA